MNIVVTATNEKNEGDDLAKSPSDASIGVNIKEMNIVVTATNGLKYDVAQKEKMSVAPHMGEILLTAEMTTPNKYESDDRLDKEQEHSFIIAAILAILPVLAFFSSFPTYGVLFSSSKSENYGKKRGKVEKQRKKKESRATLAVCFHMVPIFLYAGLFLYSVCAADYDVLGEIASQDNSLRGLVVVPVPVNQQGTVCSSNTDCDDDNDITTDICNIIDNKNSFCEYVCDDNDACTEEGEIDGVCQYINGGYIDCDDGNPFTLDVCLTQTGCKSISLTGTVDETYNEIIALPQSETYFFEDLVSIEETEVLSLLKWIQAEMVQFRTPFCWRRTRPRGRGKVLSVCPDGKEKIGLLCYTPCGTGYSRQGTLDCQQICTNGFRDDGLFCRKAEYWRGGGYPWQLGDGLSDSGMFSRCQRDRGAGKCEKSGLIVYPKCDEGFTPFGCCICRPPPPNCRSLGYNGGFGLSCAVYIKLGDPTRLQCKPEEENDFGLCYPPCPPGYDGVGPVCWQQCDTDQATCVLGCASTQEDCDYALFSQSIGPFVVATNLATYGVAGALQIDKLSFIYVAGKVINISSKAGKIYLKYGNLAVENAGSNAPPPTGGSVLTRIGTATEKFRLTKSVNVPLYGAFTMSTLAFVENFEEMTTPEITNKIDTLPPLDAFYVKQRWMHVQAAQLAETQAWDISEITLAAVGILDRTGIVTAVNAYAKPLCAETIPFPENLGENMPPIAQCTAVAIEVDENSECKGVVSAFEVGIQSTDDGGQDQLSFTLDDERDKKEFTLVGSPYQTKMTVFDSFSLSDECSASVTVTDSTPSSITCPVSKSQPNDKGLCGASVTFDAPVVTNNCESTSVTAQTKGSPSTTFFPIATTTNTFQVKDSLDPSISCADLAPSTTLSTDVGICTGSYEYTPPVGEDNCKSFTALIEGPPLSSPFVFPHGTTTTKYATYDLVGNTAMCSFDVVIKDREKPTIECPVDTIRPCYDTDPEMTGTATTTDNCEDEEIPILIYSDDTNDDINGICPEITTRTWLSTDWEGNYNECTQTIIEVAPDALTDSTLCLYDDGTINTVFTPAMTSKSGKSSKFYKLSSTTPGQFVYHAFHVGAPGETVLFSLEIPYPFVTRGTKPVYAYDWLNIEPGIQNEPCFIPTGNRFFEDASFEITMDDYDWVQECGYRKDIVFEVTTPITGFIHLSIDLDLGPWAQLLKKADRKGGKDKGNRQNQNDAIDARSEMLLLQDRCVFEFSVSGSFVSTTTVENINVYKRNQGVAGFVVDYFQNPVAGVRIQLFNKSGKVVGSAETDQDGYYNLIYEHKGKRAAYTVTRDSQSVSIEMYKGSAVVNFDVSGGKEEKEVEEKSSKYMTGNN
eukprot:scaffold136029_cov35-Attheya_sp.AAC.1